MENFPKSNSKKRKLTFQKKALRKSNTPDSVQTRVDQVARQVVSIYEQLQDVREGMDDIFDLEIAQGGLTWEEHERRTLLEQKRTALIEELAALREQIARQG